MLLMENAIKSVVFGELADKMGLFKQFNDNPSFQKRLTDMVFSMTYNTQGDPFEGWTAVLPFAGAPLTKSLKNKMH